MIMKPNMREAFLEAYDAHAEAIYRHCFFRVFSKGRAEELMQETFMKTWQYLQEGHDVENLRAFLYRVANNLIVDYVRRKREASLEAILEDNPAREPADEREVDIDRRMLLAQVKEVLDDMPEEDRQLITMRYIDDLDPKDIAVALGITPNHASVRLNRAMTRLRERFSQTND